VQSPNGGDQAKRNQMVARGVPGTGERIARSIVKAAWQLPVSASRKSKGVGRLSPDSLAR